MQMKISQRSVTPATKGLVVFAALLEIVSGGAVPQALWMQSQRK